MSKCALCNVNELGFMSGFTITGVNGKICENCQKELKALRSSYVGDPEGREPVEYFLGIRNNGQKKDILTFIDAELEKHKSNIKIVDPAQAERELVFRQAEQLMVTTVHGFDGYRITEYKGVFFGDSVIGSGVLNYLKVGVSDFAGAESIGFSEKLEESRQMALDILRISAAKAGCNAIIGVDFDYTTIFNSMFSVIANGTGVVIEKIN